MEIPVRSSGNRLPLSDRPEAVVVVGIRVHRKSAGQPPVEVAGIPAPSKGAHNKGVTSIGVLAAGVRPNIVPCKWLCRVQGLILSKAEGITLFSFCDSALSRTVVWSRLNGWRVQSEREFQQQFVRR